MNELLQKHGCSNVFSVPDGLKELMSDISREVLRWQPPKMFDFIANYLSALLITREHGIMAVKILDDLCDCRPSVSEHLLQIGIDRNDVEILADIIKNEVEGQEAIEGKEKVKEFAILKRILNRIPLDEEMSAKVCQVARNAYRDYWYRKSLLKKGLDMDPEEAWQKAANHTLEIYKKTKPSLSELHRATEKIQAAYRGYHVRRNVLRHLQTPVQKKKKPGRKVGMPGPPMDVASSREIDLGPVVNIKIREDDVSTMFDEETGEKLHLAYDPMKTITHREDDDFLAEGRGTVPSNKGIKSPQFSVMEAIVSKSNPYEAAHQSHHSEHSQHSHQHEVEHKADEPEKPKSIEMPIPEAPHPRISFSGAPPVVIQEVDGDEVSEDLEIIHHETGGMPITFEIPEELPEDDVDTSISAKLSSGPQSARTVDEEEEEEEEEEE